MFEANSKSWVGQDNLEIRVIKFPIVANIRIKCITRFGLTTTQDTCSLSFSGSGSRSGLSFKMNIFWVISLYLFKKT